MLRRGTYWYRGMAPVPGVAPPPQISPERLRLRPYLSQQPAPPKDPMAQRLFGSAFWAARTSIFLLTAIAAIWATAFYLEGVPAWVFSPKIDPFPFDVVFTALSFFMGFAIFGGHDKQHASEIHFDTLCGEAANLASAVSANMNPSGFDDRDEQPIKSAIRELAALVRAVPYAVKHQYRDDDIILVDRLPIQQHLIKELKNFPNGLVLDHIVRMMETRVAILDKLNIEFGDMQHIYRRIGSIRDVLGSLHQSRTYGAHPILINLMKTAMYLYFIGIPFILWPTWGWWQVLIVFIQTWFIVGAVEAGTVLVNPFNRPDENYFVVVNFSKLAHETAEAVDSMFDVLLSMRGKVQPRREPKER